MYYYYFFFYKQCIRVFKVSRQLSPVSPWWSEENNWICLALITWPLGPPVWEQEVWHHRPDIQECGNVRLSQQRANGGTPTAQQREARLVQTRTGSDLHLFFIFFILMQWPLWLWRPNRGVFTCANKVTVHPYNRRWTQRQTKRWVRLTSIFCRLTWHAKSSPGRLHGWQQANKTSETCLSNWLHDVLTERVINTRNNHRDTMAYQSRVSNSHVLSSLQNDE